MTIEKYLLDICQHSGIDAEQVKVEIVDDGEYMRVEMDVPTDDSGLFIGFHGETLSSLQRLVRVMFQDEYADKKIVLNVNQYREQRADKVRELAFNAAQRVLSSGRPYVFSYMPANERFIVHTTISEDPEFAELESVSEGEGSQRHLIIRPKMAA